MNFVYRMTVWVDTCLADWRMKVILLKVRNLFCSMCIYMHCILLVTVELLFSSMLVLIELFQNRSFGGSSIHHTLKVTMECFIISVWNKLNCTNVVKTPKKGYECLCEDFLQIVTAGLVAAAHATFHQASTNDRSDESVIQGAKRI